MSNAVRLSSQKGFLDKLLYLNWGFIGLILIVTAVGFLALYSAAGGNMDPWASRQFIRFAVGFVGMLVIALVDVRYWYKLAWPCYFAGLGLLLVVEFMGQIGMGAQRWINLGFIQLQPSEMMKVAVVLVLARFFHSAAAEDMKRLTFLVIPALVILAPVALVMLQPDLGTSLMIVFVGGAMFFMAGAPIWIFAAIIVSVCASIPVIWHFMHAYQKQRVLTFLNPELDPLGSGYHITQSKIALGSGGFGGKGFLEGSQSRLNFLPEKQTDFIFTLLAEEWGFLGGLVLIVLFGLMMFYGYMIAMQAKHNFTSYLALGLSVNFSLYVFINIGMVMGLLPVVGVPLPLISYGGTVMMTTLIGFGLILSCHVHRDSKVTRV